jgi:hypothetical protein
MEPSPLVLRVPLKDSASLESPYSGQVCRSGSFPDPIPSNLGTKTQTQRGSNVSVAEWSNIEWPIRQSSRFWSLISILIYRILNAASFGLHHNGLGKRVVGSDILNLGNNCCSFDLKPKNREKATMYI